MRELNYVLHYANAEKGILSGFKNNSSTVIMDIKLERIKDQIVIAIHPGILSRDFLTINYDAAGASDFSEHLLNELNTKDELNPFRLAESGIR